MISKLKRVPLRELTNFFQTAAKVQNKDFRIYFLKNDLFARVAVVVPKKQLKKATKRNRLRRRILGVLGKQLKNLPSIDLVVIPQPKLIDAPVDMIESSLLSLLEEVVTKSK